ncbi:Exosome complex exonuclease RRP46-like protein [Zea mays]|uniref:Exosome complex exonuclease RRP46-like protein n=1 Tax=Zea mays TaxID=4577 RepID=A0A1D6F5V3_MAIZE|nr:Exosome complex exonuclease RRP46-like protein [Zea mays]
MMEGGSRADGQNPNQLRLFTCTGNLLHRAHGCAWWAQGGIVMLAAVYGPKPGTAQGSLDRRGVFSLDTHSPSVCLLIQLEKAATEEGGVTPSVYSHKEPVHLAKKEKQKLQVWSRIMPCKESFAWAMIPLFEAPILTRTFLLQLKRKHNDRTENEATESNDWMSPGYANAGSSPVPTPPSGKGLKASTKPKATKGQKSGPRTPLGFGSPGNPSTPVGGCRYDSSLGLLTKFLNLLKGAPGGIVDLNNAAETLEVDHS